jgi:hypothetical protein
LKSELQQFDMNLTLLLISLVQCKYYYFVKVTKITSKIEMLPKLKEYSFAVLVDRHKKADIRRYNIIDIISYNYITFSRILIFLPASTRSVPPGIH